MNTLRLGDLQLITYLQLNNKWRPSSQSELTSMLFNTCLTHLGSEASKCNSNMKIIKQFVEYINMFLNISKGINIVYSENKIAYSLPNCL